MLRIRLSDADRERLGCPEWVEYDPDRLMIDEAIEVQGHTGYDPAELLQALKPQQVTRPDGTTKKRQDLRALQAIVWVAVRRAGVAAPLPGFTFDVLAAEVEVESSEGKAPEDDQSTQPETSGD